MNEVKRLSLDMQYPFQYMEDENGNLVYYKDYAALQQKLDVVLAENVALKGFGDKLNDMHNKLNGEGTGIQGRAEVACQQVALEAAMDEFDTIKIPATEACLNAVRAEGIEVAANDLFEKTTVGHQMLMAFAAQLRAGNAGKDGSHE